MRRSTVEPRNDAPPIRMCERSPSGALLEDWRPAFVEVLCHHRPAGVLIPPDRGPAGEEAATILRRIAEMAPEGIQFTFSPKRAVNQVLEEIGTEAKPSP